MQSSIGVSFLTEKLVWIAASSFPRVFFEQIPLGSCASQGWARGNAAVCRDVTAPGSALVFRCLVKIPSVPQKDKWFLCSSGEGICVLV